METFFTYGILPFLIGAAVIAAGHAVHETTKGWESAGGVAALSGAFQIWLLGVVAVAIYGGL